MRVAIFNNYKSHLSDEIPPSGLKNIVGYSDNIGNIVFLESISREVRADSISIYDFYKNVEYYEERYDMLILSLANMISPYFKLSDDFINSLEKTKIPICIFSIGIQVNKISELKDMIISDTAKRILKLSDKSGTIIGLRGEITKIYLDKIGIKNTQVIGCPSLFYKKIIPKKIDNYNPSNILVSGSFNGNWRNELMNIFKFGVDHKASYIIQSESRILSDKYNISNETIESWGISSDRVEYLKNRMYDYKYYCHPDIDANDLRNWMINKSIFFSDFDEWIGSMNYDLSVGVRFHGSVMSTLAGVPTLVLSGDTRVDEFVKFHGMPNIDISRFSENITPKEIYDMIDYSEYEIKYDYLKNNYINFLNKNSLKFNDTSR